MRELAQFPTPTIAILIFLMREVVSYAQPIGWGKMQVSPFPQKRAIVRPGAAAARTIEGIFHTRARLQELL